MSNLSAEYRLSLYERVSEISRDKVFIVKNTLDDRIYIKKILKLENYKVYDSLKNIDSTNLPAIIELIEFQNRLFVIEEFINGVTLESLLQELKTIPESSVIDYSLELSEVLELLHSYNPPIIHRDIKPSNIMISNDGVLKLIDFDVSRTHKTNESTDTDFLGTYGYAAPEQFGFGQSDNRTDIYSLGVTMKVLLTGGLSVNKLYSGNLASVISKCTRLDPEHRFQSIGEFKRALLKKSNGFRRIKNPSNDASSTRKLIANSFKLPGFRRKILPLKILASIWYGFLILASLGLFTDDTSFENRLSDIVVVLFLFSLTLLYGNYMNIKSVLPLTSSDNILLRCFGHTFYTLVLLIFLGIFLPA